MTDYERGKRDGYVSGVNACAMHLRRNCAGTWSVTHIAEELETSLRLRGAYINSLMPVPFAPAPTREAVEADRGILREARASVALDGETHSVDDDCRHLQVMADGTCFDCQMRWEAKEQAWICPTCGNWDDHADGCSADEKRKAALEGEVDRG